MDYKLREKFFAELDKEKMELLNPVTKMLDEKFSKESEYWKYRSSGVELSIRRNMEGKIAVKNLNYLYLQRCSSLQ